MKKIKLNTARLQLKKARVMELSPSQQSSLAGGGITDGCTSPVTCFGCLNTDDGCGGPTVGGGGGTGAACVGDPLSIQCLPPPPITGQVCIRPPLTNEVTCTQFTNLDC